MLCGSGGPGTGPPAGPHTLATTMHRAGTTAADAAALLGHTVAVHLATYATPTQMGPRAAASGLGAVISEAM